MESSKYCIAGLTDGLRKKPDRGNSDVSKYDRLKIIYAESLLSG